MTKIAVLGLGRFGQAVARELSRQRAEVLAVDRNLNKVNEIIQDVDEAESFDATNAQLLVSRNIASMDAVVVAIGSNFEASVLVTMHCHELGVPLVCAKALNEEQAVVLRKVGANRVIKPEEDVGTHLARHLTHESVMDFVELPDGYSLRTLKVPSDWVGKSVSELNVLNEFRLNIIQVIRRSGVDKDGQDVTIKHPLPDGAMVFQEADTMEVIGQDKQLLKFA
ncbi:MAG: TrkA family potassium uptake protein [bacterium]|nr:TrkA family potassium uptake protein [bacterium]